MTKKEAGGLIVTAVMFGLAAWFWLTDFDAKRNGIPLVGTYSGTYERHTTNSKSGGSRASARLIVDFVTPDGVERSAQMLDLTDLDSIPDDGTRLNIVWLPDQPGTVRSAEALAGPIGQNAGWMAGIAAFLFLALLADVVGRRKRNRASRD